MWYAGDLSAQQPELKRYSCESTLNWHADDNELLRRNEDTIWARQLEAPC
jgi:hypothetical protein